MHRKQGIFSICLRRLLSPFAFYRAVCADGSSSIVDFLYAIHYILAVTFNKRTDLGAYIGIVLMEK